MEIPRQISLKSVVVLLLISMIGTTAVYAQPPPFPIPPPRGMHIVDCIISGNGAGDIFANSCPAPSGPRPAVACPRLATVWVGVSVSDTPGSSVTGTAHCDPAPTTGPCVALVPASRVGANSCIAGPAQAFGNFLCDHVLAIAATDVWAVRCILA